MLPVRFQRQDHGVENLIVLAALVVAALVRRAPLRGAR